MNKSILHNKVQEFIDNNLNSDLSKLIFKGSPFETVPIKDLVEQIEAKKRSQFKLPSWFNSPCIYYPNKLNIEQTSSEITAKYKANIINGDSIIDLTGGFGVDSYYFSKKIKKVIHCEINSTLSELVHHNFKILQTDNIDVINTEGVSYLHNQNHHFDWIYIDPSRRSDLKGKVFLLEDSEPNIPENLEVLFQYSNNILIKASPMLDITSAIKELKYVKEIHVVALYNEVKELLFVLEKNYLGNILIKTVNIKKKAEEYFNAEFKNSHHVDYSLPKTYLYEPNSAILKAGLFNEVSHQLKIYKLHKNSHLYTSDDLIDFPGRCFKINHILSYNLKEIKKIIPSLKANITTRNFPESVTEIRRKTKLKDGGEHYLFFTTDCKNKYIILICKKV